MSINGMPNSNEFAAATCADVATVRSEPGNPPEAPYSYAVKVWYSQCQGSYFDVFAQSGFQKP